MALLGQFLPVLKQLEASNGNLAPPPVDRLRYHVAPFSIKELTLIETGPNNSDPLQCQEHLYVS